MKPDTDAIQRLGFEAWADNLIVNALEDLAGGAPIDIDMEQGDITLVIRTDGKEATATVRAYVAGKGWHYHDRVIKLKGGRP
jgi:hypothetical protein